MGILQKLFGHRCSVCRTRTKPMTDDLQLQQWDLAAVEVEAKEITDKKKALQKVVYYLRSRGRTCKGCGTVTCDLCISEKQFVCQKCHSKFAGEAEKSVKFTTGLMNQWTNDVLGEHGM